MSKRLTRSTKDNVVTGLIGGLAEYTGIRVDLLRIIAVLVCITQPYLFFLYLLISYFVPTDRRHTSNRKTKPHPRGYGRIKEAEKVSDFKKWDDF